MTGPYESERGALDENEQEILALALRAKEGDQLAFGVLYEKLFVPIYRYIYFQVRHKNDAEDLTQQVFVRAFSNIGRFTSQGVPFTSWLYTIARNGTIDYWKKKRDVLVENPESSFGDRDDGVTDIVRDAEAGDRKTYLLTLVETLSPDQREIVTLHFIDGLSYQEISQITGKSEEAIRALKHRAMKDLRKKVDMEHL